MVAHSSSAFVCLPARRGSAKKAVSTRSLAVYPVRKVNEAARASAIDPLASAAPVYKSRLAPA